MAGSREPPPHEPAGCARAGGSGLCTPRWCRSCAAACCVRGRGPDRALAEKLGIAPSAAWRRSLGAAVERCQDFFRVGRLRPRGRPVREGRSSWCRTRTVLGRTPSWRVGTEGSNAISHCGARRRLCPGGCDRHRPAAGRPAEGSGPARFCRLIRPGRPRAEVVSSPMLRPVDGERWCCERSAKGHGNAGDRPGPEGRYAVGVVAVRGRGPAAPPRRAGLRRSCCFSPLA